MSSASSLFSVIARGQPAPITCPWCLSEDTTQVDAELGIFECTVCGETFSRPIEKEQSDD